MTKQKASVIFLFGVFLAITGLVHAIYDPANIGIKTKTSYHQEPVIEHVYGQHYETKQLPIQTITYRRTTTVERLSPDQSSAGSIITSSSSGSSGSSSSSDNYSSEYQQPQPFQYQQQGNEHYQQHQTHQYEHQTHQQEHQYEHQNHQQTQQQQQHQYEQERHQQQQQHQYDHQTQQQQHQYDHQQEVPLYNRNREAAQGAVNSDWDDAENAITEYYTGCPAGHTGQLPYAYDCRRFLNCWHGRGHIQTCAAGTLFNPETLECDRPSKVACGALNALAEHKQTQQLSQQQPQQQQQQKQQNTNNNVKYRAGRLIDGVVENVDVLCPQGISGLQPHPHDCTKFINCANGNIHVQQCGPGTAYNPAMMVCDHKNQVDCGERDYHYGEGMLDVRLDSEGAVETNQKTTTTTTKIANEPTCPQGGSGLYPHPYDCTKFLNCANGITYIQSCGPGTAFNSANKVCEHKHKVNCAEHSWSTGKTGSFNQSSTAGQTLTRTTITEEFIVDILCPMGVTGLFAHPFDYTKFFNCVGGNTAIQNCVPGTIFSFTKGFCDSRDRVQFTEHVSYIVSEVSYEYSKMLMNCPPGTEGLHLYPYDCTKYIKCNAAGRMLVLNCPEDSVFSLSRRRCAQKQEVSAADHVKYFSELTRNVTIGSETKAAENFNQGNGLSIEVFDSRSMVSCPSGSNGLFPYPFDSVKYIQCRSGQLTIQTCGSGAVFSLSRKQCLLKEGLRSNDFVLSHREFVEEWSMEVGYSYSYTTGNAYLICPTKIESGIFLQPFDCTKYIVCEKGKTRIESCADGTVFSISHEKCITRHEVEAFDRVEYLTDIQHEFSGEREVHNGHQFRAIACPPNGIGLYPHPYDPSLYLRCQKNVAAIIEHCPAGTYFSISKGVCDLAAKVASNDRSSYGRSEESGLSTTTYHETHVNQEVHCPPGASGVHAHPYDCTKFLNCANGVTHVQSCGPGTAWSKDLETCDFKHNVNCADRSGDVRQINTETVHGQGFITEDSQHVQQNQAIITQIECPIGIGSGLYPHPFDYSKYFSCENGQSLIRSCGDGSVFSISRRRCEISGSVSLTDRVVLLTEFMREVTTTVHTEVYGYLQCPAKVAGVFVYPFDCTKYLRCDYGRIILEYCAVGTVFSMSRRACMPKGQVQRTDRVAYITDMEFNWPSRGSQLSGETVDGTLTPKCPAGASGMHPHPYDCTKFLNCAHGQTHIQSCGPGTAWSRDMEVCDFIDKVDCAGRSSFGQISTGHHLSQQTDSSASQRIMCPFDAGQGFYPHPFDYNMYFICQRGQSLISRCSRGKVFSISRRVCDTVENVSVADRVQMLLEFQSDSEMLLSQSSGFIACPAKAVGVFIYPFDCAKFLRCNYGHTIIEYCPPDTAYSLSNKRCMSKTQVQRMDRVAFTTETQNNFYYWQNNEANTLIFCPMGINGFFQHPYDPTKYLQCANDDTVIRTCPAGSVFSISRSSCIAENNVPSSDRCNHGLEDRSHGYQVEAQKTSASAGTTTSDLQPTCPPGASGLYAHPYDCAKFLNCANGMTYVQDCGPGTLWNSKSRNCGFAHDSDCSGREGKSAKAHDTVPDSAATVKCAEGSTGLQPHPYDCTRFLNCDSDGVTYIQACGPGTAWNSAMEVCDFIANVDCSSESRLYSSGNRGGKAFGSSTATTATNQWDQHTSTGSVNGDWKPTQRQYYGATDSHNQQSYGSNAGTVSSNGYVDRWSNMNMQRPDAKAYGQSTTNTANSGAATWTGGYTDTAAYGGQYGAVTGGSGVNTGASASAWSTDDQSYLQHGATKTINTSDRNWAAVGSSVDRQTPSQSVLYMEGSLEPNRNYMNTVRTYTAPLAPFSPSTTTSTTDPTKIYYAQPVDSDESIDQPYGHANGGRVVHPLSTPIRQNSSRSINYVKTTGASGWTPIIRHEDSYENYPVQLPNPQLMPPHTTPSDNSPHPQNFSPPVTHLMPPLSNPDNGQHTVDSAERGQYPTIYHDQVPSGSDIYPTSADASNLYGGLQPPPYSDPHHRSTKADPNEYPGFKATPSSTPRSDQSNLYGGLQPPDISSPTPTLPTPSDSSKVRVYQIYPPIQNSSAVIKHGTPHYSSPYSGVAHSRNSTRLAPLASTQSLREPQNSDNTPPSPVLTTTTITQRHVGSMPPAYNRHYYQSTTPSRANTEATDLVDTSLPISAALRALLRPYFNRSGTISEETAQQAESHIMSLVPDSRSTNRATHPSTNAILFSSTTPPPIPPIIVAAERSKKPPTEDDVELILAGEQHSLITISTKNGTREVSTKFQAADETVNQTQSTINWHSGLDHNREFHLSHPNLPSPSFNVDSSNINSNTNWQNHNHNHQHQHHLHHNHNHHHNHSSHQHDRDFHLRHPELPNPFRTREGDRSIVQTDLLETENPYAETTTPNGPVINPLPRQSRANEECQFDCGNGRCVKRIEVCDGVNNCGNRQDESQCAHLGYQVRLTGSDSPHMGRLEVKILGKWGYICDDKFGLPDANVACRELGFKLGASEIRGNSYYPPQDANSGFIMDEVECHGNETALKDCNFKGWGVHNCAPEEVVGVVCKVPLMKCPNNYWLCRNSKDCIPPEYLCDNVPDCPDKSDESKEVCNSTIEYRLEGGRNAHEGRLEVKYRGEWGTVCDDDFGLKEAQVACNSFGLYGKAKIEKRVYGPGSGPIWLDQVLCLGNETSIDKCNHWTWGEHNCNHTEDVGIRCTEGPMPRHLSKSVTDGGLQQTVFDESEFYGDNLERSGKFLQTQANCGHFKPNIIDEYAHPEERVISGTIAKRGRHPWQATIRTRGRGGISSHWCGAVLIGDGNPHQSSHLLTAAHCLAGYQKGAYFIRLGDHYANIAESSEVDSYIENWYVHEKFRDQTHMNNDIALIVLKNPVHFNDYIQPICLPDKDSVLEPQRKCTISGWGSIKSGVSTPSNILRAAEVPILSDETCKQPFVYGASLTEGMFCAGAMDESVDACDGDSGGPLVCQDSGKESLYGIISWGQHCGYANKPGVYVRVQKYIDWIYEKINFSLQQNGK